MMEWIISALIVLGVLGLLVLAVVFPVVGIGLLLVFALALVCVLVWVVKMIIFET